MCTSALQITTTTTKGSKLSNIFLSPPRGKWEVSVLPVVFLLLVGVLWFAVKGEGEKGKVKTHKQVLPNSFAKSDGKSSNVPVH